MLGQWAVLGQLGGVPRLLVWDGEGGVGRYGGPNPKLTPQFTALRGMLGTRFYVCKPNDPETKGLTERNNGFFETSFLPGRRFTGPADFNAQLAGFLARANARKRRALQGASANDRVGADRAAMGPLPPIDTATIGWRNSLVLPRDYYVRLDTCDYSVHPSRDRAARRGDRRSGHGAHPPRRGYWWANTRAAGPGSRPSPTPSTARRPTSCARRSRTAARPGAARR